MKVSRRHFVTGCATCAAMMAAPVPAARTSATWESIKGPGFTLNYVGRMRDVIMTGDRSGRLSLQALNKAKHPYGLGPIAELQGEIIMLDGRSVLSVVDAGGQVRVSEVADALVPFFVWTEVATWRESPMKSAVTSLETLSDTVARAGAEANLGDAFPFLISGRSSYISYHIVKGHPGAPAGMEGHRKLQHPFEIRDAEATLLGFWSRRHQGVFTHATSNVHIHFVSGDHRSAGHLQDLVADASSLTLRLPAEG